MTKHWTDKYAFLLTPIAEPYCLYYAISGFIGLICWGIGIVAKVSALQTIGTVLVIPFALWICVLALLIPIAYLIELDVKRRKGTGSAEEMNKDTSEP